MKKQYVLGFFFTPEGVMLILRTKLDWQVGLWNGIGGSVERGEFPSNAIAREFEEEAGIKTSPSDWRGVCTIEGINHKGEEYQLYVYENWYSESMSDYQLPQVTEEGVVQLTDGMVAPMDTTARWLIDFCIDRRVSKLKVRFDG